MRADGERTQSRLYVLIKRYKQCLYARVCITGPHNEVGTMLAEPIVYTGISLEASQPGYATNLQHIKG